MSTRLSSTRSVLSPVRDHRDKYMIKIFLILLVLLLVLPFTTTMLLPLLLIYTVNCFRPDCSVKGLDVFRFVVFCFYFLIFYLVYVVLNINTKSMLLDAAEIS